MFKSLINKVKAYYRAVILPSEIFEDNNALTKEEKRAFVSIILSNTKGRQLLEKYIRWKVGLHTKAAMRSADQDTAKFKERAYGVAEMTYDFKAFWEEIKRDTAEKQEITQEQGVKKFKFFSPKDANEG